MKVALIGDVGLFGRHSVDSQTDSKIKKYLSPLAEQLKKYDAVIANLETPFTLQTKAVGGKSAYLKSNPENVKFLKYLNITHVSLANNHMFDYGIDGYWDTVKVLDAAGIHYFGTEGKTSFIQTSDSLIHLRGYCCYSTNPKGIIKRNKKRRVINPLSYHRVSTDLDDDNRNGFFTILSCHWGKEHVHYPNPTHVLCSQKLAKSYNFVIHGHHPHVLQGIKEENKSLIAYSLGNALFDDVYTSKSKKPLVRLTEANRGTGILEVNFSNNQIKSWNFIPYIFSDRKINFIEAKYILRQMDKWTNDIVINDEYFNRRNQIIDAYITSRKSSRDLQWYISRLNMNSIKMIVNGYKNRKMYKKLLFCE